MTDDHIKERLTSALNSSLLPSEKDAISHAIQRIDDAARMRKALEEILATPDHPMRKKLKEIARKALEGLSQ